MWAHRSASDAEPDLARFEAGLNAPIPGCGRLLLPIAGSRRLLPLRKLQNLNLYNSKVTDTGLPTLARSRNCAHSIWVELRFSSKGLGVLTNFTKLEKLALWKATKIDDSTIDILAKVKSLRWGGPERNQGHRCGRRAVAGCDP